MKNMTHQRKDIGVGQKRMIMVISSQRNRERCLDLAKKTVCEDRRDAYGELEDNFTIIAKFWNTYLGDNYLDSHDVAMMMILLKIARAKTGAFKEDNYVDIAGYAACAMETERKIDED